MVLNVALARPFNVYGVVSPRPSLPDGRSVVRAALRLPLVHGQPVTRTTPTQPPGRAPARFIRFFYDVVTTVTPKIARILSNNKKRTTVGLFAFNRGEGDKLGVV